MRPIHLSITLFSILIFTSFFILAQQIESNSDLVYPSSFVHPGILQNQADLDYMKSQILKGEEPWKTAFSKRKRGL